MESLEKENNEAVPQKKQIVEDLQVKLMNAIEYIIKQLHLTIVYECGLKYSALR